MIRLVEKVCKITFNIFTKGWYEGKDLYANPDLIKRETKRDTYEQNIRQKP